MKLFLASHNFGDYVDELKKLVGDNRKALIITNARDYKPEAERRKTVQGKLELFKKSGFEARELDLRKYFASLPEDLEKLVDEYNPGLIYCIGGDVFLLATALAVSGMDDIIRRRLESNESVYAGGSAGAMVAARDIENYERDDLRVEAVPDYYGIEAVTNGLSLIEEYIIPHTDIKKHAKKTKFYETQFSKIHEDVILLNDSDVYIVDGDYKKIQRGR